MIKRKGSGKQQLSWKFRIRGLVCAGAVTALAILPGSFSLAGQVYTWTDEEGTVHFTDTPPADRKFEVMSVPSVSGTTPDSGGTANSDDSRPDPALLERVQRMEEQEDLRRIEEEIAREAQSEQIQKDAACETARKNLEILARQSRVQMKDEAGQARYLSAEEVLSQRNTSEEAVRKYCTPSQE